MLRTSSSSDCSSDESSFSSSHLHHQQEDVGPKELEKAENRKVFFLYRIFVLAVLTLSMVGVAFTVYIYVSNSEKRAFEEQFYEHAKKALDAVGISLDISLGAADAFVISMVSYARFSNSTWPFVTMPDFAVRSAKIRSLSRSVLLNVYPVVLPGERADWEAYSLQNDGWVEEGIEIQKRAKSYHGPIIEAREVWGVIHGSDEYEKVDHSVGTDRPGPYMPTWQSSPVIPKYPPFNWDRLSEFGDASAAMNLYNKLHKVFIMPAYMIPDLDDKEEMRMMEKEADWLKDYIKPGEEAMEPVSEILFPIIDNVESIDIFQDSDHPHGSIFSYRPEDNDLVGLLSLKVYWRDMLKDILPVGSEGIVVVFKNVCNPTFTYQINGPSAIYLGRGDKHNPKFDHLEISSSLLTLDSFFERERGYTGAPIEGKLCPFYLHVFPSDELHEDHISSYPLVYTIGAVCIFAFTSAVFIIYDCLVEHRQKKVMRKAVRTDRIVSSLFPSLVLDRLFPSEEEECKNVVVSKNTWQSNKLRITSFLDHGKSSVEEMKRDTTLNSSRPIADLFPETTVMFADIVHFTAWSSARQPSQVFTLLETLYFAFDEIAKKRGVFKVETIGDSYVAVVGLPKSRKDHAVVMAKFARDCRNKTYEITRALEKTLGPGTGDLQLRFGLNSGPVTAGVLRGEKSRFQLFGDTVNTAARMESLGQICKIQASQSTAELLEKSGKSNWLNPRDDLVQAKGKGMMQTFWVEPKRKISSLSNNTEDDTFDAVYGDKSQRLIDWSIDVLGCLLKRVIAHRPMKDAGNSAYLKFPISSSKPPKIHREVLPSCLPTSVSVGAPVIDEVIEIIDFPIYRESAHKHKDPACVKIEDTVFEQLCSLVTEIGTGYKENPFHNFEHASQVALSTVKLISRINGADYNEIFLDESDSSAYHCGPLTQFAWVFAALVHDIDHSGLTNKQLIEEGAPIAQAYNGKSVAEQNSINVAWAIFMQSKYSKLRETLCPTKREMQHFRQLVINSIIATDIFDKDLVQNRNDRWKRAFQSDDNSPTESAHNMNYRKATLVVEFVIQASDISHTMQHWHIYRKWNERLFEEMHMAYLQGCSDESPSVSWYKNELSFFDFYVIPLAKKLKECGVLGVLSEELLDFAQKNRAEWETRGKGIVEEMLKKCQH